MTWLRYQLWQQLDTDKTGYVSLREISEDPGRKLLEHPNGYAHSFKPSRYPYTYNFTYKQIMTSAGMITTSSFTTKGIKLRGIAKYACTRHVCATWSPEDHKFQWLLQAHEEQFHFLVWLQCPGERAKMLACSKCAKLGMGHNAHPLENDMYLLPKATPQHVWYASSTWKYLMANCGLCGNSRSMPKAIPKGHKARRR